MFRANFLYLLAFLSRMEGQVPLTNNLDHGRFLLQSLVSFETKDLEDLKTVMLTKKIKLHIILIVTL